MLGSFWGAAQLATSQEGLSSVSEWVRKWAMILFYVTYYQDFGAFPVTTEQKSRKEERERERERRTLSLVSWSLSSIFFYRQNSYLSSLGAFSFSSFHIKGYHHKTWLSFCSCIRLPSEVNDGGRQYISVQCKAINTSQIRETLDPMDYIPFNL
jgi:hypothetical protein